jgi:hypothetical protein
MAPDEAAAFRALTAKKTQPDAEALARLQALGLVKTIRQRLFSRASLFLYMSLFSAVCFIGTAIAAMPDLFPRMALALSVTPALEAVRASVHLPPSLLIIALGSLLTSIPMMLHIVLDEAQLTSDGATLAALLRTVAEDKAVPAQAAEVLEADAQPNIYRFRDVALAG